MGACCCCCASESVELYYPPPVPHYPIRSGAIHVPVSVHSSGLIVDTNLDTTIPDTFRPPPAPVPYDTPVRRPQTPDSAVADTHSVRTQEATVKDTKSDENAQSNIDLLSVEEVAYDLDKCGDPKKPCESFVIEEDVCPTCLEEYDVENPKIITKCEHHFHLACILEWKERSDTCPVCDQEMVFSTANESSALEIEVENTE